VTIAWTAPPPEDEFVVWDEDESLDVESDEPEVAVSFHERSKPRTVDHTDPDGSKFAAKLRAMRREREAAGKFDAGGHATVIERGHEVADADLPPAVRRVVQRCRAAAWDVEAQRAATEVAPLLYVGTTEKHNRGDVRTPAHVSVYFGVQGVLDVGNGIVAEFWATWVRDEFPGETAGNTFQSAVYWDPVNGRLPAIGATDFEEWLAIFAPKPEPKPKRKRKEDA
jgi:hypothetical protein